MKKTLTMFAVAAVALFAGVNAKAENHPVGVALKGPVHAAGPSNKAGGAAGLTVTAIAVGTSGFYPCYNCAGGGDVDLPYEQNTIPAGVAMVSSIQMQDTFYSGAPTIEYAILQGGKVISSSYVTFPFDLFPNEEALAYFPDTAPLTTGPTQVVMKVLNGSTVIGTSVYNIFVY
jgi:hypothetical protein